MQHRVRVYARKTGSDIGPAAEFKTKVSAYYTNPVSAGFISQDNSVNDNSQFPDPGQKIYDHTFHPGTKVLDSLRFLVDEMDGSSATKLCELRVTPQSFPTGTSSYQCYYESDNGAVVDWHFNIIVNTCTDNVICPIFIAPALQNP